MMYYFLNIWHYEKIKSNIYRKKQPCLFINLGGVLKKLLEGSKMPKQYKPIIFNTLENKHTITEVVNRLNIRIIVIETSKVKEYKEDEIHELIKLRTQGVIIYEAEEFYELINKRIPIVRLNEREYLGDAIFSIRMRRRYKYLKRLFDLLCVLMIFPFALVLIIIGGLLVKLTSKGSVFFSQVRVGENSEKFVIRKIRTMETKGNDGGFTQTNDTRITTVGKFLRLTKIDELPQLWNILIGDMSIVGPRPERPEYVEQYSKINPFFNLRHMVKPGVSGWAQIHIPKATPQDNLKKLEYDLFYIKKYHWSLDIIVLWETIKIVFRMDSN